MSNRLMHVGIFLLGFYWAWGADPTIILEEDWQRTFFDERFEILPLEAGEDPDDQFIKNATGFKALDKSFYAGARSKNLVKFTVFNPSVEHRTIYFGSNDFEYLKLWIQYKDSLVGPFKGGHLLPLEEKQIKKEGLSFLKGNVPPEETAVFYLLMENKNAPVTPQNSTPPSIFSAEVFMHNYETLDFVSVFFYGAAITMGLFNLLLFLLNPFRAYLYYTLYIIGILLFVSNLNPVFAFSYYGHMDINVPPISSSGIVALIFYTLVGKELLRTKEYFPRVNKLLNILIGALVFSLLGAVIPELLLIGTIINFTSALTIYPTLLVIGAILTWRGDNAGTYFLIASSIFLLTQTIFVLQMMGLVAYDFLGITPLMVTQIGVMTELALFSLGLGQLYNEQKQRLLTEALHKEQILKEQEEKQRNIVENKNQELEEQVQQRTNEIAVKSKELEKSYQELQMMQHQLIESEKMASLGQFTAGVAAEIKDPINFVANGVASLEENSHEIIEALKNYESLDPDTFKSTELETVLEKNKSLHLAEAIEDFEDLFQTVNNGVSRTVKIVTSLRNFSRLDEFDYKKADIHDGLDATLDIMQSQFKGNIKVEKKYSADLPKIFCYPGRLNQAFMSVIEYCVQALKGKGTVELTTRMDDKSVVVEFRHNGTGLEDSIKRLIMRKNDLLHDNWTGATKLKYAQYIIKEHEGKLIYEDDLAGWCVFSLYIPARQS